MSESFTGDDLHFGDLRLRWSNDDVVELDVLHDKRPDIVAVSVRQEPIRFELDLVLHLISKSLVDVLVEDGEHLRGQRSADEVVFDELVQSVGESFAERRLTIHHVGHRLRVREEAGGSVLLESEESARRFVPQQAT